MLPNVSNSRPQTATDLISRVLAKLDAGDLGIVIAPDTIIAGPTAEIDSLELLELLIAVEDELGRELPSGVIETLVTVQDLFDWFAAIE